MAKSVWFSMPSDLDIRLSTFESQSVNEVSEQRHRDQESQSSVHGKFLASQTKKLKHFKAFRLSKCYESECAREE